jgi:hypothetical protein
VHINEGPSHYGRDFRDNNDHHQPPPPPRDFGGPNSVSMNSEIVGEEKGKHIRDNSGELPFRKDIASSNPNRNFRGPPPRGSAPPPPPGGLPDRDHMIKRDSSWASDSGPPGGPRGNFRLCRSFTNEDGKEGPHGPHNNNSSIRSGPSDGPPLRLSHREPSFGISSAPGNGPLPPKYNRDGPGGREPPFTRDRDGGPPARDGHGFRDGHPHSHPKNKGSPLLFSKNKNSSFERGGDPPLPPALHLGPEGSNRDRDHT